MALIAPLITLGLASDGTLGTLARVYRAFARRNPEGFRLIFAVDGAEAAMARASVPLLRATGEIVGPDAALDAARLLTAWATLLAQSLLFAAVAWATLRRRP